MSITVAVELNGVSVPVEIGDDALAAIAAAMPKGENGEPSPFLTIPEAAEVLRTRRQRVDDLLSARRLDRVKDGARTLIRREQLFAYLDNNDRRRSK